MGGHDGVRRQPVQVDQHVDGRTVEALGVGARCQQPGEGVVAEILQQQQPVGLVGGENGGGAEAEPVQVAGDPHERPDVLVLGRRVHQHRDGAVVADPVVAPEGGVAGQRSDLGMPPAGRRQERLDLPEAHDGACSGTTG